MKIKKKLLSSVVILGLITSLISGCGADTQASSKSQLDKQVVTIGYLPITHAIALFEEKERLEESDNEIQIELQKFSSWTDLTDALNAGKIDGASVLVELAMNAVSQGIDLKAVGLGHRDGNVIIVSNEITSGKELKGKNFAIPSNQSSHNILLQEMLKKEGLSLEDINVTQLSPAEMPSSLASGAIDGYCVAEPFGAQAVVNQVGHVLYDSEELWEDSICCALVLRGEFIEGNPKQAEEFSRQYLEAGNLLGKESELALAQEYLGQEEKTLEASLEWISYNDLSITKEDYESLVEKVKADNINENPPTYEEFVYQFE